MNDAVWVLDASADPGDGLHCFVPVRMDDRGEVEAFVIGIGFLSPDPPPSCERLLGVIHEGGQEACDAWCAANESEVHRLFGDAA